MYEPCTRTQANEFDPGDPERGARERERGGRERRDREEPAALSALSSLLAREKHGPFKSAPRARIPIP